jgi:hypothetical protein
MAAFFRGLLLFLFGALVGAGGILFFTPTFNVVVSRNPGSLKPVEFAPAAAPVTAVAKAPAPAPAPVVAPVKAAVAEAAKPAPAVASAEPSLDFKSISEHLILWPNAVTVTTATTAAVYVDGKKAQDLPLEAGTVLQLSKVLADGSLEVRAKGAKFEIKSAQTDFSAELGKRVADLVAKGTKVDSPFVTSSAAAVAPAVTPVAPAPAVPPVAVVDVKPKGPLTLAQKVDILFGVKPEVPVAPAVAPALVTPTPVAPPAAAIEPTPSAEPKAAEKGKDLDRKINQLFK